jgi:hypothetical protein
MVYVRTALYNARTPLADICALLERVAQLEDTPIVVVAPHDLHSNRQPTGRKPARPGHRQISLRVILSVMRPRSTKVPARCLSCACRKEFPTERKRCLSFGRFAEPPAREVPRAPTLAPKSLKNLPQQSIHVQPGRRVLREK